MAEKRKKDDKPEEYKGPSDRRCPPLADLIEEQFREFTPNQIDVFPLDKSSEKLERLHHIDIKPNQKISTAEATRISNDIFDRAQLDCDNGRNLRRDRRPAPARYRVCIIDNHRGGLTAPVASYTLWADPRPFKPAPEDADAADGADEEDMEISARRFLLEGIKLEHEKSRFKDENEGRIVGDTLLVAKSGYERAMELNAELAQKLIDTNQGWANTLMQLSERNVEAKAVEIDGLNAAENRKDQAARRDRDQLWFDVGREAGIGLAKQVGDMVPGFFKMIMAKLTGQSLPDIAQLFPLAAAAAPAAGLPANGGGVPAGAPPGLPEPEEIQIIKRLVEGWDKRKVTADYTAAERLFGKEDEKTHAIISEGIFSREQTTLMIGVKCGKLGLAELAAILPNSGKPEALRDPQLMKAIAFITEDDMKDIMRLLSLLTARTQAPQAAGAPNPGGQAPPQPGAHQ